MTTVYETGRLILRVLDSNYYRQVLHFLDSNKTLFDTYERDKPDDYYTPLYQQQVTACEYNLIQKRQHLRLYVFLPSNPNKIIGTVSFSNFKKFPVRSCEIGYKFDPDYHHHGYALETIEKALDIILTEYDMHKIYAYVQPVNIPSIHLLERMGFERKTLIPEYAVINGVAKDHYQYVYNSRL